MEYTYDEDAYSDIYKSAHGVRPGRRWYELPPEQKQAEWDHLVGYNEIMVQQERDEEEAAISACLAAGAPDRETAIRWLATQEP